MQTQYQQAASMGLHQNPITCPSCKAKLVFETLKDLSKAYTHHDWECSKCGNDVSDLVYGKQKK